MYDIQFEKLLKNHQLPLGSNKDLNTWRKQSYENFIKLGFPTQKNENWKYTNLKPFLEKNLRPKDQISEEETIGAKELKSASKQLDSINPSHLKIVFVNGQFSNQLSDSFAEENITIKPWGSLTEDNLKSIDLSFSEVKDWFCQFNKKNTFSELNSAFFTDGIFIHVKAKNAAKKTIHLVHLGDQCQGISNLKNFVFLNAGAEINLAETHLESSREVATNTVTDIFLSANAKLSFLKSQVQNHESIHFSQTRIKLCKDSQFSSLFLCLGARLSRQDVICEHIEENASTNMGGLCYKNKEQHSDFNVSINHNAPYGTSQQLFKAILNDRARTVFNGKIYIASQSQKVNASLLNKSLMLSKNCEVDTKPELEIFADDVKATHGATIGQLNQEQIFYLISRGIPLSMAHQMLNYAFSKEPLKYLKGDLKEEAERLLSTRLQELTSEKL